MTGLIRAMGATLTGLVVAIVLHKALHVGAGESIFIGGIAMILIAVWADD